MTQARPALRAAILLACTISLTYGKPQDQRAKAAVRPRPPVVHPLSLIELIHRVRTQNDRLIYQRLEFEVAGDAVRSAQSIFEFQFVATALHEENNIKNTIEE